MPFDAGLLLDHPGHEPLLCSHHKTGCLRESQALCEKRSGTYFFFAIVPNSGGSLVWDIAASLVPGGNTVTFSTKNAEEVR